MKKVVKSHTKSEKLKIGKSKEFRRWMADVEEYIELVCDIAGGVEKATAKLCLMHPPPYDFEKVFMGGAKPEHAARWFLSYVLTYGCYNDDSDDEPKTKKVTQK